MKSLLKAYRVTTAEALPQGNSARASSSSLSRRRVGESLKEKLSFLFLFKIRLVPLVIFFAVLVLGARVTTLFSHMGGSSLLKEVHASANKNEKPTPLGKLDSLPEKNKNELKALDKFDPFNMTADQYRALKGVLDKGNQLADREHSISEKEQVLQALVKKMDEKISELKKTKEELKVLVDKIEEDENANTKRLVKMTESMKPAQAAKVLEGIEFSILLEIMEKVKETKASAILAAMDVEKAGYLMTALSKRRKIFKKGNPSKSVMEG
ncbi:MAG: hypothetical protein GW748_05620 [Alphaproteobacteria bacterium]|nr:hypothetical protein [Alphaproteobacteria bacterium]NCQ67204.1 hypothetical protein [Alphaproteobacteria bacterium]NCT07048.1 hypothetical protein [Alphaproteobacteria bacterium]